MTTREVRGAAQQQAHCADKRKDILQVQREEILDSGSYSPFVDKHSRATQDFCAVCLEQINWIKLD